MYEHAVLNTKYFPFESYDFSLKISGISLCVLKLSEIYGPLHKVVFHAVKSEVELKVMNAFS